MIAQFPRTLATTNRDKQKEWNEIFKLLTGQEAPAIEILDQKLSLLEIQSMDPTQIAAVKAVDARKRIVKSVLVEDVSFSLNALKGFPGPLYALVEKTIGIDGIHQLLAGNTDRKATATITIAFVDTGLTDVKVVRIDQPGTVPVDISGIHGFGWDPLFIPRGHDKTFAEMTEDEKNVCSMRRVAIEALMKGVWDIYPVSLTPLGHYFS